MKRLLLVPAAALILSAGLMSSAASAAPAVGQALKSQSLTSQSMVENVRHRCTRICKGWGFKRRCKTVCRGGGHHHHRHHHRRHRH
ncbi:MAG: hypothetical protein Q7T86_09305 [Hyphomicrobiaceae bacterium]|jgi:hypothetical protein|nr:hypothetical protein [Hyphomicrobiaceae bacterium]